MAQNIYDDQNFFEAYIQLPRQVHGLEGAPEWLSFRSLIPDIKGATVLDLGCGFGWLCRWARENGAEEVLGFDLSENMLAKAKSFPQDPAITYRQADLETLELPSNNYQVALSSLTLHVEHPVYTSPRNPTFMKDEKGNSVWGLDAYVYEGPRMTNWLVEGVIKQHRTIATYISMLMDVGFTLSAIDEWGPTPEMLKETPHWAEHRERPMFLLVKATKSK